jgi:hypothetical protein
VTRFRNLAAHRRPAVLRQLISDVFRTDAASRRDFNMRVEVNSGLTRDCHRLDVSVKWIGRLPADASVELAADEELLKDAYDRDSCVFRELVPLGPSQFETAMGELRSSAPTLRYKSSGEAEFTTAPLKDADPDRSGFSAFDTPEVRLAELRLNVCLPYPADLPMYPVMLGAYAVAGRATITIATDGRTCGTPHALQFLGQTPTWLHHSEFHRSELSVEIGDDASVVEPNSGVVFYWRVESSRP